MKLHPATIPYRALSKIVTVLSALVFVGPEIARRAAGVGILLVPLGLLAVFAIIAYETAHYRRFTINLTDDALEVRSGVFARKEREIPYHRIQNVDVSRNIVQRLLSIAHVKVETAGGGATEAALKYVSDEDATHLQTELRTRKREATTDDEDAHEPEVEVLYELGEPGLIRLSLLSFDPRVFGFFGVIVSMGTPIAAGVVSNLTGAALLVLTVLGLVAISVLLWLAGAATTFIQYYGFRLTRIDDDLRYERGLLQRYDGSIPLEKVQAFAIEENVLMRQFDFAGLAIHTAGYAPGQGPDQGSEAAVPLATRQEVIDLATQIDPDAPYLDGMRDSFARPPERARKRYAIRYSIAVLFFTGIGAIISQFAQSWPWYGLLGLLLLTPIAARATYRNRGWSLDDEFVLTENGFWNRTTHAVPYDRVQTVIDKRSLFQRRWGLATVYADTASSSSLGGQDPAAVDVPLEDADELRSGLASRLFQALGTDSR